MTPRGAAEVVGELGRLLLGAPGFPDPEASLEQAQEAKLDRRGWPGAAARRRGRRTG